MAIGGPKWLPILFLGFLINLLLIPYALKPYSCSILMTSILEHSGVYAPVKELQELWLVFVLQFSAYTCNVHNNSVLLQPHARRKFGFRLYP